MNQTSSIQTGAITLTAASLVPIIDWAATSLHIAIPVDAQLQLAAMLITGGHALYNYLRSRAESKAPAAPAGQS
ncbi:hypothetical protein [Paraburkholderia tropica]|uniref:hypothetical protein n=1 Tax=Paraburkholderia tropica TaxID=92647 RepID=UPI001F245152|nr:hypothetical protein [Paraburkholderia tropica]